MLNKVNLQYIVFNGFILAMVIMGIPMDITGAYYVASFIITATALLFILSILFTWDEMLVSYKKTSAERFNGWPTFDKVYDLTVLTIIVWNGHFYLGAVYMVHVVVSLMLNEGAKEA